MRHSWTVLFNIVILARKGENLRTLVRLITALKCGDPRSDDQGWQKKRKTKDDRKKRKTKGDKGKNFAHLRMVHLYFFSNLNKKVLSKIR